PADASDCARVLPTRFGTATSATGGGVGDGTSAAVGDARPAVGLARPASAGDGEAARADVPVGGVSGVGGGARVGTGPAVAGAARAGARRGGGGPAGRLGDATGQVGQFRSATAMSLALVKRSAGSFSSACSVSAESGAGTARLSRDGGTGGSLRCFTATP